MWLGVACLRTASAAAESGYYEAKTQTVWDEARALVGKSRHDEAVKRFVKEQKLTHIPPSDPESATYYGQFCGPQSDPNRSPFGLLYLSGKVTHVSASVARALGYTGQVITENIPFGLQSEMTTEEAVKLLGPPTERSANGNLIYRQQAIELIFTATARGADKLVMIRFVAPSKTAGPSTKH